jgi:hypothetical protein
MDGHDLTHRTVTSGSDLCRSSLIGRSGGHLPTMTVGSDQLRPDAMGEERRARVLGLGCSNSDGVSSYDTRTMRGNILLTFGGGDGRGWSGNGGAVETKLFVGERLHRWFSVQGEGRASTGVAWRCFSTGQRSSKRLGVGSGSWGRLATPARFGRSIRAGGAPIYRGNPSTRSRRGDDLDSISNLKQTRHIATDFGKGINSVWRTLCGYERCRVHLRIR